MARKRIADKEPAISKEGAAVASAKSPITGNASDSNKARAPRASANAVTHRHKKTATVDSQPPATVPAGEIVPMAPKPTAKSENTSPAVLAPSHEDIAIRAYLLAESRGFQAGSTQDDWFEAERQLRSGIAGK